MHVPDEYHHFARAEQIASGDLFMWKRNSIAGGIGDSNVALDRIMNERPWRYDLPPG